MTLYTLSTTGRRRSLRPWNRQTSLVYLPAQMNRRAKWTCHTKCEYKVLLSKALGKRSPFKRVLSAPLSPLSSFSFSCCAFTHFASLPPHQFFDLANPSRHPLHTDCKTLEHHSLNLISHHFLRHSTTATISNLYSFQ